MQREPHEILLTDTQVQMLASVMDALIPPSEDRALPGAGEIGLAEQLNRKAPDLLPVVAQGLATLGNLVRARGRASFAQLGEDEKQSLLEELAATQPALMPGLLFQTYSNYYQHPRVLAALGLEARAPYPAGYELEAGDFDLLGPVRHRGRLFRDI